MPQAAFSREQLVERLAQVFRRHGYEGASMTRIAAATGLGRASLYHHFPLGKEQMAEMVIEATRVWFEEKVFVPLEGNQPPRQRLSAMLAVLSDYYDCGRMAGMPLVTAVCEDRDRFAESIRSFYARWIATMTQLLTDAGLARDIAARRAHDGVERIEGAVVVVRATSNAHVFVRMAEELPDQLLAGADRAAVWTVRNRFSPLSREPQPARLTG